MILYNKEMQIMSASVALETLSVVQRDDGSAYIRLQTTGGKGTSVGNYETVGDARAAFELLAVRMAAAANGDCAVVNVPTREEAEVYRRKPTGNPLHPTGKKSKSHGGS